MTSELQKLALTIVSARLNVYYFVDFGRNDKSLVITFESRF